MQALDLNDQETIYFSALYARPNDFHNLSKSDKINIIHLPISHEVLALTQTC